MQTRLDRLASSPDAALFADRDPAIRSFFASQLPLARTETLDGKHLPGEVLNIYLKLNYEALFISECYRGTIHTPPGLNIFDAVLALQKIQQQELVATELTLRGIEFGGLTKDEIPLLRRQFFDSTENEYYLLKFQPQLRAYFRDTTRRTEDDTAFYEYLIELSGTQRTTPPCPGSGPSPAPSRRSSSGISPPTRRYMAMPFRSPTASCRPSPASASGAPPASARPCWPASP